MYVLLFMTFFEEYCISVGTDSHSSSRPSMKPLQFYWILCCLFSLLSLVAGYNGNFFQRIARDFKALSSRSTTRWLTTCMHKNSIPLRPSSQATIMIQAHTSSQGSTVRVDSQAEY